MEGVNITIVGAGAVGLAVAGELAAHHKDVVVIERNASFGAETSSRNSEVIHAGIYYPKDSLKSKLCIEGRDLLYEFCRKNNIPHKRIGKLIIAINKDEEADLNKLLQRGRDNGVNDLRIVSKSEVRAMEPHILSESAIFSPSTGIFDTHSYMKFLAGSINKSGGRIAYNSRLMKLFKSKDGYDVTVIDDVGEEFTFHSNFVINCAGLNSDKVAAMVGLGSDEYRLKYCKGDYFRLTQSKANLVNHLVYPVPRERRGGLGIHVTLDMAGSLRLGPDDEYVQKIDYAIDSSKAAGFHESVSAFLPFVEREDLSPDTSGIRPKLQGQGEGFKDFIIRHEEDKGLRGFINLVGIESPGLTASLAIARMVALMV